MYYNKISTTTSTIYELGISPFDAFSRRLNTSFHYRTKFIHPETCRFISEEECIILDKKHEIAIEK